MQILLVGAYPPPIGGNSIHIQRLHRCLLESSIPAQVIDYGLPLDKSQAQIEGVHRLPASFRGKIARLVQLARATRVGTVVHFHVSALGRFRWVAPLLLFLFRHHPKVITIHSGSFVAETNTLVGRRYLGWLLPHFQHIITVNAAQAHFLESLGIAADKLVVIPPFLQELPNPALLPTSVAHLRTGRTTVITSGYTTRLYNYDVLIDCIERLDAARYHFIFAWYGEQDEEYEAHLGARLAGRSNVLILRDLPSQTFVTVLNQCDLYVRTTLTDGDAQAVREALFLGKTVFATDCVKRPPACHLFPQHDSAALLRLFEQYEAGQFGSALQSPTPGSTAGNFERLLEIYQASARTWWQEQTEPQSTIRSS